MQVDEQGFSWYKNIWWLVWKKKNAKSRCEFTINPEFVYVVLHSSIVLKNGKVYESETFFIKKVN